MLPAQALEDGEALLDHVEPGGIGLQAVQAMADGAGQLGNADAQLFQLGVPSRSLGLPLLDILKEALALGDPFEGRALLLRKERKGRAQCAGDGLGMAEHPALGLEVGLLPGPDLGSVDLGSLEAQQVDPLAPGPVVAGEGRKALGEAGVLLEGGLDAREQRGGLGTAAAVEHPLLKLGLDEAHLVALAMDAQQVGSEIREQPQGGGLVVDEDPVASAARDLAADDHLLPLRLHPRLFEN
jgi:hypothetical protein